MIFGCWSILHGHPVPIPSTQVRVTPRPCLGFVRVRRLYISYRPRDGTHRTCQLILEPPDLEDTFPTRIWTPGCHSCRDYWSAWSHSHPYYEQRQDALLFSMFGWMLGSRDERRFGCGPCPTSALAGLVWFGLVWVLIVLRCLAPQKACPLSYHSYVNS